MQKMRKEKIGEEELIAILNEHEKWLSDNTKGKRADLSGACLSEMNLYNCNLSLAILNGTDFSNANLCDANLSGSDLSNANLFRAYLRNANLNNALLLEANLQYALLSNSNISYANLKEANLFQANLSFSNLSHSNLNSANLSCGDLRYANFDYGNLRHADFGHAMLTGANLQYADLTAANLTAADLNYADLRGACIDFTAIPMWYGAANVKIDINIATQIAAHFCLFDCNDEEFIKAKEMLLPFAKKTSQKRIFKMIAITDNFELPCQKGNDERDATSSFIDVTGTAIIKSNNTKINITSVSVDGQWYIDEKGWIFNQSKLKYIKIALDSN